MQFKFELYRFLFFFHCAKVLTGPKRTIVGGEPKSSDVVPRVGEKNYKIMKRTCLRINTNTNENSKHGVPSDLKLKIIYG